MKPIGYIAVGLELMMLVTFVLWQAWPGVALWFAYLYFSATAALFRNGSSNDDATP